MDTTLVEEPWSRTGPSDLSLDLYDVVDLENGKLLVYLEAE